MGACVGEESVDGAHGRTAQRAGTNVRLRRLMNRQEGKNRQMIFRAFPTLCMGGSLFVGGVAVARRPGSTSGPSAGKNVEPSTATEKKI
jgi:hypothetical protein